MPDDWRKIKTICNNCRGLLESRPAWGHILQMKGAEPMEYRHTEDGCTVPAVYDPWGRYQEWKEADND